MQKLTNAEPLHTKHWHVQSTEAFIIPSLHKGRVVYITTSLQSYYCACCIVLYSTYLNGRLDHTRFTSAGDFNSSLEVTNFSSHVPVYT